jgi:hypothetical protein
MAPTRSAAAMFGKTFGIDITALVSLATRIYTQKRVQHKPDIKTPPRRPSVQGPQHTVRYRSFTTASTSSGSRFHQLAAEKISTSTAPL